MERLQPIALPQPPSWFPSATGEITAGWVIPDARVPLFQGAPSPERAAV